MIRIEVIRHGPRGLGCMVFPAVPLWNGAARRRIGFVISLGLWHITDIRVTWLVRDMMYARHAKTYEDHET